MEQLVHDIHRQFGDKLVGMINRFAVERDKILNAPTAEYDKKIPGYISDPNERRSHIQRKKEDDVKQLAERLRGEATRVLENYPGQVERRREKIHEEIVAPLSTAPPELLARTAMFYEDDFNETVNTAVRTGNDVLLKALFAEAIGKDLPEVRQRIASEAGGVFAEYEALPSPKEVEKTVQQQRWFVDRELS